MSAQVEERSHVLKTEPFDKALQRQRQRFPQGVYRLRSDVLNPLPEKAQSAAWYAQPLFRAQTVFLLRYGLDEKRRQTAYLTPRGSSPALCQRDHFERFAVLLNALEPVTEPTALEEELRQMGLQMTDLLWALHGMKWSVGQIRELLAQAKRQAKARTRKEKLKRRGAQPTEARPPRETTRPLPPESVSPPDSRSLNSQLFSDSVNQVLEDLTDRGGMPVILDPSKSLPAIEVHSELIQAVQIVQDEVAPKRTRAQRSRRPPSSARTVQVAADPELLVRASVSDPALDLDTQKVRLRGLPSESLTVPEQSRSRLLKEPQLPKIEGGGDE